MKQVIYLTGPPGTGKSSVAQKLKEKGFTIFWELIDKFPKKKFPNPRSFSTAEYIFKQNVKRNKLIKKEKGIIIIDRHPLENILIAKGLLENKKDFEKIERKYKNYKFEEGIVIKLTSPKRVHKKRYISKNVELISEKMINDILSKYKDYSKYLSSDLKINSIKDVSSISSSIIKYLKKIK